MQSEKQTAAKEAKRNLGNCTEKVRQCQAEMDAMEQARGESRAILERDRISETKMSSGDRGRAERALETLDSDLNNGTRRLLAARTLKKDFEKELKELNTAMIAATTEVVKILPQEGSLEEFNDPTVTNEAGAVVPEQVMAAIFAQEAYTVWRLLKRRTGEDQELLQRDYLSNSIVQGALSIRKYEHAYQMHAARGLALGI